MISFIFPFPPSVNTMYFQGKTHGQKFPSKKLKQYKQMLHSLYADEERIPLTGKIKVRSWMVPPDKRDRDADNYQKAILDGLVDLGVIADDCLVKMPHPYMLEKDTRYNRGYVIVLVSGCDQAELDDLHTKATRMAKEFIKDSVLDRESMLYFIKPTKKNSL